MTIFEDKVMEAAAVGGNGMATISKMNGQITEAVQIKGCFRDQPIRNEEKVCYRKNTA